MIQLLGDAARHNAARVGHPAAGVDGNGNRAIDCKPCGYLGLVLR
ncbi:hypothetical protein GVAMD_0351 [Gardnerella vaginalis AMD]|nr:hypothetical protein GVAMD_0351 [Gardnerella vaginalis AMD]